MKKLILILAMMAIPVMLFAATYRVGGEGVQMQNGFCVGCPGIVFYKSASTASTYWTEWGTWGLTEWTGWGTWE